VDVRVDQPGQERGVPEIVDGRVARDRLAHVLEATDRDDPAVVDRDAAPRRRRGRDRSTCLWCRSAWCRPGTGQTAATGLD
jgi:hypothetical protein